MKKYILGVVISATMLYGGLVDAIAILVNNKPITLYDIDQKMAQENISKQTAVSSLIDEILYKQELKKYNISVDILDVDEYIEKLATANNMNIIDFKILIRQKDDYNSFVKKVKEQLTHQKLIERISRGNIKIATKEDLKLYYNQHKKEFTIANKIDVVAYMSKNKNALLQIKQNPMLNIPSVVTQELSFTQDNLNPKVKYILNTTDQGSFSAIFTQNRSYNMFYIKNKKDIVIKPFNQVKNQIFSIIMKKREAKYLQEYFETLKLTANIKILR